MDNAWIGFTSVQYPDCIKMSNLGGFGCLWRVMHNFFCINDTRYKKNSIDVTLQRYFKIKKVLSDNDDHIDT